MYYFYVLKSKKDFSHYYGSTTDLKNRLQQHNGCFVSSTKHKLPIELVYYEAYMTIEKARAREKQVKRSGSIRSALINRIV